MWSAVGGRDPETADHIRAWAPQAYRTPLRAVVAGDFAALAQQNPKVLDAAAAMRWSGSRRTVCVTIDPHGGAALDDALRAELLATLESARIVGIDVEVTAARPVAVEVELALTVQAGRRWEEVADAVRAAFAAAFPPDRLPMGAPVYASAFIATALGVEGVVDARLVVPTGSVLVFAPSDKPHLMLRVWQEATA
jgi:uncharacterized phage protein gp47/JayE